jgi:toxin ParE1/3/4
LIDCFSDLASQAKRGRALDNIHPGYKVLAYQAHFVVYKETARFITIIRILHRRMNIANHL